MGLASGLRDGRGFGVWIQKGRDEGLDKDSFDWLFGFEFGKFWNFRVPGN